MFKPSLPIHNNNWSDEENFHRRPQEAILLTFRITIASSRDSVVSYVVLFNSCDFPEIPAIEFLLDLSSWNRKECCKELVRHICIFILGTNWMWSCARIECWGEMFWPSNENRPLLNRSTNLTNMPICKINTERERGTMASVQIAFLTRTGRRTTWDVSKWTRTGAHRVEERERGWGLGQTAQQVDWLWTLGQVEELLAHLHHTLTM